ncbi:MAG: hypothetical protein SF162_16575 [bacterium]|nr:hypothetical protein [bacterium]
MTDSSSMPDLMKALGFSGDDLEANRAGRISHRQRRSLAKEYALYYIALALGSMIFLVIGFAVAIGRLVVRSMGAGEICGLLIGIGFLLGAVYTAWIMTSDLFGGVCRTVTGDATFEADSDETTLRVTSSSPAFDHRFKLAKSFPALPGGPMRVYFTPRMKTLIGMERV